MVIFQYNLFIFGIHLWTMLCPKPCDKEPCYKEVEVYMFSWSNKKNISTFCSRKVPYLEPWTVHLQANLDLHHSHMSQRMTKPTKWHVRPAKTPISLGIHPVWSESCWPQEESLGPWLPTEHTAKTLIRLSGCLGWSVFAGHTCHFVLSYAATYGIGNHFLCCTFCIFCLQTVLFRQSENLDLVARY